MDRQGLVGAMPVGNRWRAQGYIDGMVRYLGTFDTEEEAHAVFMRAREVQNEARDAERVAEYERIRTSPTYVYEGGVGRGAALNGRRFKMVEARDQHASVVVPIRDDNTIDVSDQRVVLNAYLRAVPVEPTLKAAALTVEPAARASGTTVAETPADKADVLRFIGRASGRDIMWAFEFVEKHARGDMTTTLAHLRGAMGVHEQLEWLRTATSIPSTLLDEIEQEQLAGLFGDPEVLARQAKAVESVFGRDS